MGVFKDWMRDWVADDRPYDELVRLLLTSTGDTIVNPAANFWHPSTDFMLKEFSVIKVTPSVTRLFLGVRVECAECHNHPLENFTQDDFYGFAAFFSRLGVKHGYGEYRRTWYLKDEGEVEHPITKEPVAPKFLAGKQPEISEEIDRREVLADWTISPENPFFARATVNRIWHEYFQTGIVEPFDDFRSTNAPSNPELLDRLAGHFIQNGYRFKPLHRLILNSRTYQLKSKKSGQTPLEKMLFASYAPRQLTSEVLLDTIVQTTGADHVFWAWGTLQVYPEGTSSKDIYLPDGPLLGKISVAADAPLGPHMFRVWTLDGYSTAAMFNVGQFSDEAEAEPNDSLEQARRVEGPAEVHGLLDPSHDIDFFAIEAAAGERWSFDLRSIEYGSSLECKMALLDAKSRRVAYNDDRNNYDETPFIDHVFDEAGTYFVMLDLYRGPRGFSLGSNSSYTLRVSKLPAVQYAAPLGAPVGTKTQIRLTGSALASVERVYLTEVRSAEYARMTYPYTMPIRVGEDPPTAAGVARIEGKVLERSADSVTAEFEVPADARPGLWKLWAAGTDGVADGPSIELTGITELTEATAGQGDWRQGPFVINGSLGADREKDTYQIQAVAGEPLHIWTLSTQLGIPHLDPVIKLHGESGKKLAENDDTVGAYGTLIGNPDSTLFYTPEKDQRLTLTIEDRTKRGGPS